MTTRLLLCVAILPITLYITNCSCNSTLLQAKPLTLGLYAQRYYKGAIKVKQILRDTCMRWKGRLIMIQRQVMELSMTRYGHV